MRYFCIFFFVFLIKSGFAQKEIDYQKILAPPSMLGPGNIVTFSLSKDGAYILAGTNKEVRCWTIPEGELIYRFQAGRERKGEVFSINAEKMNCTVVHEFEFVNGGKVIRVKGMRCGQAFMEIATLPEGEIVRTGREYIAATAALPDSWASTLSKERMNELAYNPSPLSGIVPKDCYKKTANGISIFSAVADPDDLGKNIVFFSERTDCPDEYYKGKMPKEEYVDQVLWKNKQGYPPSHYKFYLASVSPDGKDVQRLAQVGQDYWHGNEATYTGFISPNAENVIVVGRRIYKPDQYPKITAFDRAGNLLWGTPPTGDYSFHSFGEYNNVWLKQTSETEGSSTTAYVLFDINTGKELERVPFPKKVEKHVFIPALKMVAVARNSEENNNSSVITLHNADNGGIVSVLTDPESVQSFAVIYNKEQKRLKAEEEERLAQQKYWAQQQRIWNEQARKRREEEQQKLAQQKAEEALVAGEKFAAKQAEHQRTWKTCPKCNGTGGEKRNITTYSGGRREVYNGFGGKTVFYDKSNPLFTESKFIPCDRCWGKGEVKRY